MTVPQHLGALDLANETRLARAAVKRDLQAARATIAGVIDLPCVQSMRVAALLTAQRRWGQAKTSAALAAVPCGDTVLVRDLTARQRKALLAYLSPSPYVPRGPAASKPVAKAKTGCWICEEHGGPPADRACGVCGGRVAA